MAILNTKTSKEPAKKAAKAPATGMKALYADEAKSEKSGSAAVSQAYRVLIRPIVSEKASRQQSDNQYFFAVAYDTNRIEVAKAIKAVYGVAPIKVNMIRVEGKARRFGGVKGRRKDWKKAIVTLPKGKTISVYEGV